MNSRLSFSEFVARRYSDPIDSLTEHFSEAVSAAASIGALLVTLPELDRRRRYLPDLNGKRERKYYYIGGLDRDSDGTVWPCITFGTYKGGGESVYWKPRNLVWQNFENARSNISDASDHRADEYNKRAADLIANQAKRGIENLASAEKSRDAAAEAAATVWEAATLCDKHRYLTHKKVDAYGLRVATKDHHARLWNSKEGEGKQVIAVRAGDLLIPMIDADGKLWNIQRIDPRPDSSGKHPRWFLTGSRKHGLFFRIPGIGPTWLAEGYSTAATVHAATGFPVVVAFDAGNLAEISQTLRGELFAVAADNDAKEAGKRGAEKTGLPYFMPPSTGYDWNDHAAAYGLESVASLLRENIQ